MDQNLNMAVRRRMACIANHMMPAGGLPAGGLPAGGLPAGADPIALANCSSPVPDSYSRTHTPVPTHPPVWNKIVQDDAGKLFEDIIYEKAAGEGFAKITINRPERRNSFRPQTVKELMWAFNDARDDIKIGAIIFTGTGTQAFCSGGDQSFRGKNGYADYDNFGRLNVLDLQVQIRRCPKPVIAMVAGYAVGGGHVLHMVCDITIAADNAVFGQTGPKVGSFDAGYGASIMSRLVGPKRAKEMWFLAKFYTAAEAERMGLVNVVVPLANLEQETVKWCREIMRNSPTALRVSKSAVNASDDGDSGLQALAGDCTLMFYGTEEGNEGRSSYLQHKQPDFSKFPRLP